MNRCLKVSKLVAAMAMLGLVTSLAWSTTPGDVARIGKDLTASGGEKAASSDGAIPQYSGLSQPESGWSFGKVREEYWKYKGEKPLFVIDASNVDKYASKLTVGQIQMLRQVKGYTMPVYPSHRECGAPKIVEENTKQGASKSSIASDGWSLDNATLPGYPFPVPENGIQAVWNWLTSYLGQGSEYQDDYTYISPRPGSGTPIVTHYSQLVYFPWGKIGQHTPKENGGLQSGVYYLYKEPAALSGQGTMQRFYFGEPNDSYYYFTGQRRVRRLPAYSYDAPLIGYENQYPSDTAFIFSGNPDRFDWKLVGKKEIYVSYNNFGMQRFDKKLADATLPGFVNPEMRRYELHRVWEVVGTVKAGMRHSTPKKTLYFDEDSWMLLAGDDYDAQGKIWKVKENYVVPQWDLGACAPIAATYNDLTSGRYILDETVIGTGKDIRFFGSDSTDPRLTESYFTGENLGAISDR